MQIRIVDPSVDVDIVAAIPELYIRVFEGPPWFEVGMWRPEQVKADFRREMGKENAICVVAMSEQKVVGFAWGYSVYLDEALCTHLDAQGLHDLIDGRFFYLDECGVDPAYQGRKIGSHLIDHIFRSQQHDRVLLRTKRNSPMRHIIMKRGGKIEMSISKKRVMMTLAL
jgi:ribosomal protein S18 acetylase RimI-like enzyme